MKYPIKFYLNKTYLIRSILVFLALTASVLRILSILWSDSRFVIKSSMDIIVPVVLVIGAILMATLAFDSLKNLKTNPYYVEFNQEDLNLFMGSNKPYLRVNWKDITDVKFGKGAGWFPARWVELIPKDREKISDSNLHKILRKNWQNKVIIRYMGQGDMSHEEFYEFIKSEFLKYKPSPHTYKSQSTKLFSAKIK